MRYMFRDSDEKSDRLYHIASIEEFSIGGGSRRYVQRLCCEWLPPTLNVMLVLIDRRLDCPRCKLLWHANRMRPLAMMSK